MRILTIVGGLVSLLMALVLVVWLSDLGGAKAERPAGEPVVDAAGKNKEGEYLVNPFERPAVGPFAKLKASEMEFDFGQMKYKAKQSHTFVVQNVGETLLKLAKGPSTCQCTMSDLASDIVEVAPGGRHEITVTWEPDFPTDDFSKQASVWTNDPAFWEEGSPTKDGKIVFTVKGQVINSLELEPPQHSVGTIEESRPTKFTSVVYSRIMPDLQVSVAKSSSEFISAELVPLTAEELEELKALSGWKVEGQLEPRVAIGRVRESLTLQTNDDERPELEISLEAFRQGPVSIAGRFWNPAMTVIDFQRFKAADGASTTLSLYSAKGTEPLNLKLVEKRPEFLEVTVAHDDTYSEPDRDRHKLMIRVPAGRPPERLVSKDAGFVRFETNLPDVPEIKFHVIVESY